MLVVGGGIHGVGVAQAAAAAGHSVLLLERQGLAAGTSSRSSKLIHGGLRYLETADIPLVRESLRERELLLRLAPELVTRQRFFIPVYHYTSRRPWVIRTGLSLYAVLAGLGAKVRFRTVPRAEWGNLDGLTTEGLQAVFQYWDAQTDDVQLTRAVMRSAASLGARSLCPASFERASVGADACRVTYRYRDTDQVCEAKTIVNAAGPWATSLLERIDPTIPGLAVENVQGSHLELLGRVERGCYYMEVPFDRRAVFLIPWRDETALLGTTEHAFQGDPASVTPFPEEIDYLMTVYRHYFPGRPSDILDAWAGLRVLPGSQGKAFSRSRETQLPVDDPRQPRVVTIFGGKLTGYRATAQKVMRQLRKSLPVREPVADTRTLPLRAVD